MQKILSHVRRCVEDYEMIKDGDQIAVGVSGGKDSLLLLTALSRLSGFYPEKFSLTAITIDMGFDNVDFGPVSALCGQLSIPFHLIRTDLGKIIFDTRKEENPCSLCANMRRGILNDAAVSRGIRKVALAHHFDDVVETVVMSLFFEGRLHCFMPVTYLDRRDITVIRPLLYVHEYDILKMAKKMPLPVVSNPCPANGHTKRQEVKELLKNLDTQNPGIREKLFGAIQRYPLAGWQKKR